MASNNHDVKIAKTSLIRQIIISITAIVVAYFGYIKFIKKPEDQGHVNISEAKQVSTGNNSQNYNAERDITFNEENNTNYFYSDTKDKNASRYFNLSPNNASLALALKKTFKREVTFRKGENVDYIEVTTTGELIEVSDGIFMYQGGHIVFKVNGITCKEFPNQILEKTPFQGNSKTDVELYVNQNILKFIENNTSAIIQAAKKCIH